MSLALACLTVSLALVAVALGLVPDRYGAIVQGRKAVCEEMAIHSALAIERDDYTAVSLTLSAVQRRNPELLSAGLRGPDGRLVLECGEHQAYWGSASSEPSTATHMHVPIARQGCTWGTLEMRFVPIGPEHVWSPLQNPVLPLLLFLGTTGFIANFLYLRVVFKRLNLGTAVIPRRVRTALNTLAEGVVILDRQQRIVLANEAFGKIVGRSSNALQGEKVSELAWKAAHGETTQPGLPWERTAQEGKTETGTVLGLEVAGTGQRTLAVNSAPILADDGSRRGTLATFDNLTALEQKNDQLRKLLKKLKRSRASIRRQNHQLKVLATRDPLTRCLNRRAFFSAFEDQWSAAKRYNIPLSCVIVDIDHFKQVNDRHGHKTGDEVLQQVAQTLKAGVRKNDLVCRYGGEEFCVLLPHQDLDGAEQVADRLRASIAAKKHGGLDVTASLGVSCITFGAADPRELLDQADRGLYAAKRGGRNRVIRWDRIPPELDIARVKLPEIAPPQENEPDVPIPFHAVTALMSALAHRHPDTAEHSKRVADLCVAMANGLMTQSECYVLEVAALLHDIGKLGVPDRVLLKPGPLDPSEWELIRTHENMGEEIIGAAFTSRELTAIIRNHHAWFAGSPHDPGLPRGEAIPLAARILSIADAFDAMVSDRVYRRGRSREEACAELRRCAGTQFDPKLVEYLISEVLTRKQEQQPAHALAVSKQTALRIGRQIESLANALDARDTTRLAAMASRLSNTASTNGIKPIAEVANRLKECVQAEPDMMEVTKLTISLLDLCRATFCSYLPSSTAGEYLLSAIKDEVVEQP